MLRAKKILPRALGSPDLIYVVTANQAVVTLFVEWCMHVHRVCDA